MHNKEIKFHDESLQKIMEDAKNIKNETSKMLDKISNDIKNLEKLFQSSSFYKFKKQFIKDHECFYLNWNGNRLMYCLIKEDLLEEKPLIECKADVRVKSSRFLAEFFHDLLENHKKIIGKYEKN